MSDRYFEFWRKWLLFASLATAGLGVALIFFDNQLIVGLPGPLNESIWGTPEMPAEVVTYHRFVTAVLGATILSWGVLMAFVTHVPFRKRERWAWWAMFVSLLIWFIPDTSMSLYYGVWPNAVFNVSALVMLLPPLLFTKGAFADPSEVPQEHPSEVASSSG